jgi:transcriptional regulator with XRE-family HTH domain
MSLREYLFYNNITREEMGKKLRVTSIYVGMICNGKVAPSYKVLDDIERITNYEVTRDNLVVDLYGPRGRLTGAQSISSRAESNMSTCP